MNIVTPILHHARTQPDAIALVKGDFAISYRDLARKIARTAGHLVALGVGPSDRIGVWLKDSWEHVVAVLAAGHLGAVVIPIDWHARGAETARIAEALDLKLILVEPDAASPARCPTAPVDDAWHAAVDRAAPHDDAHEDANAPFVISPTSGTTGAPKFMLMSHLQEYFSLVSLLEPVTLPRRCRYLSTSPLYFGAGRRSCHAHLLRGDTVILHPTMISAAEYVDVVARQRADAGFIVPTIVRQLLQLADRERQRLAGMVALISGGAPLFGEEKLAAARLLTANFHERYGTAATGGIATLRPGDFAARSDSVGQPHMFMRLEIVDEDDRVLPPGATGRLRLRGAALGSGLAGPAGWAAASEGFRQGWYYPGELAALDDGNFLFIKGRASDVIIRGGAKIYPGEIEAALQDHEAVVEAAVFGQRTADGEEAVIAYVVTRRPVEIAELFSLCRRRLTAYRIPRDILAVDRLPRNAAGKVDKVELGRMHEARRKEGPG